MTTETPLTCYICGQTSDDWMTVDMIGLFEDQNAARDRFIRTDVSLYRCARVRPADSADIRRLGERATKTVTSVLIKQNHKKEPESYLFVCPDCEDDNSHHAQDSYEKYGKCQ